MSYSTPERLSKRIGPRIYAGLTAENGTVANDDVAQGALDNASNEVNLKIGTRYVWPVLAPPAVLASLRSLEEQIAHWLLYVYRGFGPQETGAAAAKVGYDSAMATLLQISKAELDLYGAAIRDSETDPGGGFVLISETPHFDPPDDDNEWPHSTFTGTF